MPSYDISRSRFRLADGHTVVLTESVLGDPVPQEFFAEQQELLDCGLIDGTGAVSPLLAPLLETLIRPVVVVTVESDGRQGRLHHGLLIGGDHAVAHQAWPGEAESEYSLVEPRTAVGALANMVNLQAANAADAPAIEVVEATVGTLDAGLAAVDSAPLTPSGSEDRDHVRQALADAGGLEEPQLSHFTEMLMEVRASWRMTAAWRGRDGDDAGLVMRGFGVWDCGPLGYWHRELPAEPVREGQVDASSVLRLVRVRPGRVWELISELLPQPDELRFVGPR
ncbi:histidine kinase [Streptomyces sp. NPDC032472]|uniref:histidine kinase n=1 Tax=Streptomyces sp. NPDC032472 TaxID=3155018 RepID=UPI003402FC1D